VAADEHHRFDDLASELHVVRRTTQGRGGGEVGLLAVSAPDRQPSAAEWGGSWSIVWSGTANGLPGRLCTGAPADIVTFSLFHYLFATSRARLCSWSGDLAAVVYAAFVVEIYSRAVAGWAAATYKRTKLVLDALQMALWLRGRAEQPTGPDLAHRGDARSPYASLSFTAP
jgi:transposase InsO family protein